MRTRKLVSTVLFAVILILETVYLGWSLADPATLDIVSHAVRVAYALYCLVIATRSVKQETVSYHAESIIHLTGLTSVAAVVLGLASLLPTKPPPQISSESADGFAWLRLLVFITYVVTCVLSAGTPQGPPLHFEPADIYLPKEVSVVTNHELENVTGVTGTVYFLPYSRVYMSINIARCFTVGYTLLFVHDEGGHAWKCCRKSRNR